MLIEWNPFNESRDHVKSLNGFIARKNVPFPPYCQHYQVLVLAEIAEDRDNPLLWILRIKLKPFPDPSVIWWHNFVSSVTRRRRLSIVMVVRSEKEGERWRGEQKVAVVS